MNAERRASQTKVQQDPGVPGATVPEELPPQDESEPDLVPESEQPDTDNEGHMAPNRSTRDDG
jgi:hypothetical protein